jgi:hypothetical protein
MKVCSYTIISHLYLEHAEISDLLWGLSKIYSTVTLVYDWEKNTNVKQSDELCVFSKAKLVLI